MEQSLKKIFSLSSLVMLTALTLSGIAAWYSILGLTAIFAAAVIPVIIMGASLELGKVVTTVWLHRYWDRAGLALKLYLLPAVLVLALITSMGIFGFLSKAHIEQGVTTSDATSQVAIIDERIRTYRENIDSQRVNIETARNAVKLLDEQVTARIGMGFDDGSSAERAVQIRRQQRAERESLASDINQAQNEIQRLNTEIGRLNEERIPIAANLREVEAKVGPIKYIAALIYGDNPDQNTLERAVRWVIILLVIVFDPLALVLIMAALSSYRWEFGDKRLLLEPTKEIIIENPKYKEVDDLLEDKIDLSEEPIQEPTAANTEITVDTESVSDLKKKDEQSPKKSDLTEQESQDQKLENENIEINLNKIQNLNQSIKKLSSNLRKKFSWKNLTDWSKSPILNLVKKVLTIKKP
jgi:hypothetical protein